MNNMSKSITKKDANGEDINYSTYTYDNFGEMTSRADYVNKEKKRVALYKYDSLKRLTHYYEGEEPEKDSSGKYIDVNYVVYDYDINENLTSITYPSGIDIKKVVYNYGKYNRLIGIYSVDGNSNQNISRTYTYGDDNRVNEIKDYNTNSTYVQKTYEYDKFGRCTSIDMKHSMSSENLREYYKYKYDKNSNIVKEEMCNTNPVVNNDNTENEDSESEDEDGEGIKSQIKDNGTYHIVRNYEYDNLDRINEVKEYSVTDDTTTNTQNTSLYMTTKYTYDSIGNRTSETKNGKKKIYIYDNDGLNLLKAVKYEDSDNNLISYEYDPDGNMTKEEDTEHGKIISHTYDEEGQIIKSQISVSKGEQTKTQTVINTYNGSGERIEKELRFNDENGNEVSEKTLYYVVNDSILYTENVIKNNNEKEEKSITSQNIIAPNGSVISTLRDGEYFTYTTQI